MRQGRRLYKEVTHARIAKGASDATLTLRAEQRPRIALEQLWQTLPEPDRRHALETLSRIVAQQVFDSKDRKEVRHEDR